VSGSRRRAAIFLLPALLLAAVKIAPLTLGARTLYLRDILNAHLPMRIGLGRALRAGELPLVDPLRAGGQGLLGNANAVPLYPDNLLLLVTSDLWQLNAHFWMHWLLAFAAMYALGRAWGLRRDGAAVGAVAYALSGYFLSQLNLYNAVAGAALAPALAAALLWTAEPARRRGAMLALGVLWSLELLAGDPILAAIALLAALLLSLPVRRSIPWRWVALALVGGTLVAAPQWVETLRLLPGSHRGFWGQQTGGAGTPRPAGLVDLVVPLFFGEFDRHEFWGGEVFGGLQPLYGSLAPGLLVIGLIAVGLGRGERRRRTLAGLLAAGLALAFSGGLLVESLSRLPGAELFRFPVKFALLAALAASLAAGQASERLLSGERAAWRRFGGAALALALIEVVLWTAFHWPGSALGHAVRIVFAPALPDPIFELARSGWLPKIGAQLLLTVLMLAAALAGRRRAAATLAALVALHAATQIFALRSLLATDDATRYSRPPALLAGIPSDAVTTNGCYESLLCHRELIDPQAPDRRILWSTRRAYDELFSFPLLAAGRRDELHLSPEGLDAFPEVATASAIRSLDDLRALRVLAAMGVDRLIVDRPLDPAAAERAEPLATGLERSPARLYALRDSLPDAIFAGRVTRAPSMNDALRRVVASDFDPRIEAVVSGAGAPFEGPSGRVTIRRWSADDVRLEVDSEQGGVVAIRRAWLSIWSGEVDGAERPLRIANLNRLAIEVPPGPHAVRFRVSRRPLFAAAIAALVGACGLFLAAYRGENRSA